MSIRYWVSFVAILLGSVNAIAQANAREVYVKPHVRNGTTVPGHYRTAPNGTNRDNFSTRPNTNPHTGKIGTITPDDNSSSFTSGNEPSPSSSSTFSAEEFDVQDFTRFIDSVDRVRISKLPKYQVTKRTELRQNMGKSSAVIEVLPAGSLISVEDSFFPEWWRVSYNGETGYVMTSCLSRSRNIRSNSTSNMPDGDLRPAFVVAKNTSLYATPDDTSTGGIRILKGTLVRVRSSIYTPWWEIEFGSSSGFINRQYLNPKN